MWFKKKQKKSRKGINYLDLGVPDLTREQANDLLELSRDPRFILFLEQVEISKGEVIRDMLSMKLSREDYSKQVAYYKGYVVGLQEPHRLLHMCREVTERKQENKRERREKDK